MKTMLTSALLSVLLLAVAAAAQPATPQQPDEYLGDWKGTVTVAGKEQTVAVYLIPHGDANYEAKIVSEFNKRVPTLFQLRAVLRDGEMRAIDAIPFEVSRVLSATDNGVVVDASLWIGKLDGKEATGRIAGKSKGAFKLAQTTRTSPTLGQKPPADAVVLFDGKSLDAWQKRDGKPSSWQLLDNGAMQVRGGDSVTKEKFHDFTLHLEFRLPCMATARGQARANSGVYVHGRYEVQVLDSYGLEGADNECGGIYKVARPAANMCFPPQQWQTYDMTFRAPRFDADGKKTENARITVSHNGVTIHDNLELPEPTPGGVHKEEGRLGGILLQDHGNPVQFRNIWVQKLG